MTFPGKGRMSDLLAERDVAAVEDEDNPVERDAISKGQTPLVE